jgi:hypothetical protein
MPPDNKFEHEDDAWKELQRRGYAVLEHNGQYCITDCGEEASPWFVSDSLEARVRNIRAWANDELAIIERRKKN